MTPSTPLTDYLKHNNIAWFPINLEVIDGKKQLTPYKETHACPTTNDFKNLTQEDLRIRQQYTYKYIAIDTSRVGHVDVDDPVHDSESARQEYPHFLSTTKKLPHFFTEFERAEGDIRKSILTTGLDYLCGMWSFAPRYGEVINPATTIPKMVLPNPKIEQTYQQHNTDHSGVEIKELLEVIPCDLPYGDWCKVGMALKISGYEYDAWSDWSRERGVGTDQQRATRQKWDSFEFPPEEGEQTQGKVSFGTIVHFVKHYSPEKAEEILPKLINRNERIFIQDIEGNEFRTLTNRSVAELFHNEFKNKYIFDSDWFMIDSTSGIMSMIDKKMVEASMLKDNMTYMTAFLNKIISNTDSEKRDKLIKIKNKTESSSFMKASFPFKETRFADSDFKANLNTQQNTFGFTNGVWDMDRQEFRRGLKTDYISKYVGFKWEDKTDHEFFDTLLYSMFEDQEMTDWFKVHLGSLFVGGNKEEQFIFWDGCGRNGKGCVDHLVKSVMGMFYTALDVSYFTTYKKNDNAPEPHLLKMKDTKCVMINELGENTKLITSKIKQISGNDTIPARALYSNDVIDLACSFKCVIQTNHLPAFTDIDDGLLNRICPIHFPFSFVSEDVYDAENPQHRRANIELKGVCQEKKVEFFNYIMAKCVPVYQKDGLYPLPQMVKNNIDKYRCKIDDVASFVKSELKEAPFMSNPTPITTNGMYNQYKAWREQVMETDEQTSRDKFVKRLKNILGEDVYKRVLHDCKRQVCITGYKFVNQYEYNTNEM
tara:strand:- start:77 stop:2374 length:2298 start_codon:yes stop_codon:yes gene_type:complete